MEKYDQNKPKFNGVCSTDNLPKIKNAWCIFNKFYEDKSIV